MFSPPFFTTTPNPAELREYYAAAAIAAATVATGGYSSLPPLPLTEHGQTASTPKNSTPAPTASGSNSITGDEEWKNIHTMLNCILQMVEKTKRALGILQTRAQAQQDSSNGNGDPSSSSWLRRPPTLYGMGPLSLENSEDLKRQIGEIMAQAFRATEERVIEVKRRAGGCSLSFVKICLVFKVEDLELSLLSLML